MRPTLPLLAVAALIGLPLAAQEPAPGPERQRRIQPIELTDAQQQQMRELRQRFADEDRADRETRQAQMEARRAQLDGILTEEQRAQRQQLRRQAERRQLRQRGRGAQVRQEMRRPQAGGLRMQQPRVQRQPRAGMAPGTPARPQPQRRGPGPR